MGQTQTFSHIPKSLFLHGLQGIQLSPYPHNPFPPSLGSRKVSLGGQSLQKGRVGTRKHKRVKGLYLCNPQMSVLQRLIHRGKEPVTAPSKILWLLHSSHTAPALSSKIHQFSPDVLAKGAVIVPSGSAENPTTSCCSRRNCTDAHCSP